MLQEAAFQKRSSGRNRGTDGTVQFVGDRGDLQVPMLLRQADGLFEVED
jgi:hypothetical protein